MGEYNFPPSIEDRYMYKQFIKSAGASEEDSEKLEKAIARIKFKN